MLTTLLNTDVNNRFVSFLSSITSKFIDAPEFVSTRRPIELPNDVPLFIVKKKYTVADGLRILELYPQDGAGVIKHRPGQYLELSVYMEDFDLLQTRKFLIISNPNKSYYQIAVKEELPTVECGGDIVNHYLYHEVQVGEVISLAAPAGNFYLTNNLKNKVFVSEKVDATPVLSMFSALVASESLQTITWIQALSSADKQPFSSFLQASTSLHDNVYLHLVPPGKPGKCGKGCLNCSKRRSILHGVDLDIEADYYIGGSDDFVKTQVLYLMKKGIDVKQIHFQ